MVDVNQVFRNNAKLTFYVRVIGKSISYPTLPLQTRTWRFPSYGSAQILFTESSTRQATLRNN